MFVARRCFSRNTFVRKSITIPPMGNSRMAGAGTTPAALAGGRRPRWGTRQRPVRVALRGRVIACAESRETPAFPCLGAQTFASLTKLHGNALHQSTAADARSTLHAHICSTSRHVSAQQRNNSQHRRTGRLRDQSEPAPSVRPAGAASNGSDVGAVAS